MFYLLVNLVEYGRQTEKAATLADGRGSKKGSRETETQILAVHGVNNTHCSGQKY
jgi:hypothetical protein